MFHVKRNQLNINNLKPTRGEQRKDIMKAIVKATSNGNKVEEYINSYRLDARHAASINTREMRRQLRTAISWMKNIEAMIRQTQPEYQIRWSNISKEIWLHYIYHLESKANRHANRIAKMYEAMETICDFYFFLDYEYGKGKLVNTPREALNIYKGEKQRTA